MAGDRVDEDLAAIETAVAVNITLHDPEERSALHIVQAVVFPGNRQHFQRGKVDQVVCPHQGFVGEDLGAFRVYDRLEMELEEVLFHQEVEGAVEFCGGGGRLGYRAVAAAQPVQVQFAQGQLDQVFQRRFFPAAVHGGTAAVHFHIIRPGTDGIVGLDLAEEVRCAPGDGPADAFHAFPAVYDDELVAADPRDDHRVRVG